MQTTHYKILKLAVIIEFNQYTKNLQMINLSASQNNGDLLEQYLVQQKFKVTRINHNTKMEPKTKYIDLLDNQFNEHLEEAKSIGRIGGDYITEDHVCLLVYVRCQSIVPRDSDEIEIFDPKCPRSNPQNLPQSKKLIKQIDLKQAQGLLLIQYCFAQGQSWDSIDDQSKKDSFKSFIENLQNFQLRDCMEYLSQMLHISIIGKKELEIIFKKSFSPIKSSQDQDQIQEIAQPQEIELDNDFTIKLKEQIYNLEVKHIEKIKDLRKDLASANLKNQDNADIYYQEEL
ncbi:UNKNOWN [Stylonychia lemnae]|uniref:Uncharacterized protein n=1 Tax=Stylonychia lemnae TaxID=5949 RepID=A0A078BA67_STYLE|nr:UNKNOWN [Stylonychia lemnae]|eukprot:CDW90413.1 UNKNOWN [Stylonychia lemnae]